MSTYHERAKPAADELERAFYAALDAADRWVALMDALAAEEEAKPEPNAELVRRFRHLRGEAGRADQQRRILQDLLGLVTDAEEPVLVELPYRWRRMDRYL